MHIDRFVVAVDGRGFIPRCGELAPVSHARAESAPWWLPGTRRDRRRPPHGPRAHEPRSSREATTPSACSRISRPVLRAHGLLDRAPHLAAGKDPADCQTCSLFRQLRTVRDGRGSGTPLQENRCRRNSRSMSEVTAVPALRLHSIDGGVTAPAGFKAAGVSPGIKAAHASRPLALMLFDDSPPRQRRYSRPTARGSARVLSRMQPRGLRRQGARDRLQQRLRECVHGRCRV